MGEIRKQTIYSSLLIYTGFGFGIVNQYLLTRSGNFTTEQYGLFGVMFGIAQIFLVLASFGLNFVVLKFYHYYQDNLSKRDNDLFTWAFLINILGFVLLLAGYYFIQPLVIRKFSLNAALLVEYYSWIYPIALGLILFTMMETFFWCIRKTVVTNFLKETLFRLLNMVLIIATVWGWISYHELVALYSILYLLLAALLCIFFIRSKQFAFHFKVSRVTRKFHKKIARLWAWAYAGQILRICGMTINGLIISSKLGLSYTGLYAFAEFLSSVIQAPQKSIESAATGALIRAWKDKNHAEIKRIYHRSSLNMLILSALIFGLIGLNYDQAIYFFHLNTEFLQAKPVFLILGVYKMIDMGTGLNSQIISTSNYWGFEFLTDALLIILLIYLNYQLIPLLGITGSALTVLIGYGLYNFIRFMFLYKKFSMQPFHLKHLYALLIAATSVGIVHQLFHSVEGIGGLILRSITYILCFSLPVFYFNITPDAQQLAEVLRKKWKK